MARDESDDVLPDQDAAKEFYARYEPKEVLGRLVFLRIIFLCMRWMGMDEITDFCCRF